MNHRAASGKVRRESEITTCSQLWRAMGPRPVTTWLSTIEDGQNASSDGIDDVEDAQRLGVTCKVHVEVDLGRYTKGLTLFDDIGLNFMFFGRTTRVTLTLLTLCTNTTCQSIFVFSMYIDADSIVLIETL
jgi:hypothetical protein